MHKLKAHYLAIIYLTVLVTVSSVGYGCARNQASDKIAIKINDYTLTAGEFQELFSELTISEDTALHREQFLENLINRKLLLQEAQRLGLDKKKDFLRDIENFWEQSLLKIVIDVKIKELSNQVSIDDAQVEQRYKKWALENPNETKSIEEVREIIRWQMLREQQAVVLNTWIDGLKKNARITVDKKAVGIE